MAVTVIVRSGEGPDLPTLTFDAPRVVIGRGDGCEVRLPDPSVSHRHASLRQRGPDWILVDEGSTNGTFVGPVRLTAQAPRVVRNGELVRVGRVWLELRVEHAIATPQAHLATRELALALVADALRSTGEPSAAVVEVLEGAEQGQRLELAEADRVYVVGRGADADLTLTDADASRRHLELRRRGTGVVVRELGSKNGTTLDGASLVAGKEQPWPTTARLRIGQAVLGLTDPVAAALLELESAVDEALDPREAIDLPGQEAPAPSGDPHPPDAHGPTDATSTPPPRPPANRARNRPAPGFSRTDAAVAGVAVVVLGLSLLLLWWLFRSE